MRLAMFGQAAFGREVAERLEAAGHEIVGVWTPPDSGRPDPLATLAEDRGWPVFRHKAFRRRGEPIAERVEEYRALEPDLNVLAFVTAILPPCMADFPEHGSICFHPSLLPAYRGGAALSWQIILGARESGVSVFRVTDDVDHGPLVVQRGGVEIAPDDTMASLYFDKLYPLGVEAMVEAVAAIAEGRAAESPQGGDGASFQGLVDDGVARIDWSRPAEEIERLIRGCDPAPGALARLGDEDVRLYGGGLAHPETTAAMNGAAPGTLLGVRDGALEIATGAGAVRVGKLRRPGAGKVGAADAGLPDGTRFA